MPVQQKTKQCVSMVRGFINGRVYTSFAPVRVAEAFAVAGNRIAYVGESRAVEKIVSILSGDVVDLRGRVVLPGFIDAHMHLLSLGIQLNSLDLRGVTSIEELKRVLKEFALRCGVRWVVGRGWDQELFKEKRFPTRWDLDEAVSSKPVYLSRVCGHMAVLNSLAMKILRLEELLNSNVLRDDMGIATGLVRESAAFTAWERVVSEMPLEDLEKSILDAAKHLASLGVTAVDVAGCSLEELKALLSLWSKGLLPIRVRVHVSLEVFNVLKKTGITFQFGDEFLRVIGVKLFIDGSLGARTAWLSKPYADDPSNTGVCVTPPSTLEAVAREADSMGLQLAVHAIGDKALDAALAVYSRLSRKRHRIEHASLVRDDQLELLEKVKPVLVVQPHFVIGDWWVVGRVSVERVRLVYRFRDFVDRGIPVAFSTDAPVEPANPWETIYAAVTRGMYEGVQLYSYTQDQALPANIALHLYTHGSAYALGEEELLGSIDVGKLADFIIIDRDPLEVEPRDLKNVRVLETYVGGKSVWPEP